MKLSKLPLAAAAFISLSVTSQAGTVLTTGFDDITTLAGQGWVLTNNSSPVGTTGWFQGQTVAFNAQAGPNNSYISANFNNAGAAGNVSNWLILPSLVLQNGDTLSFWTRTEIGGGAFGDNLQVRMSTNGTSTNVGATATSVGDFTNLLNSVGTVSYPENWTLVSTTISGLAGPTTVRLALRYLVTDTGINGDFIGIDTLAVDTAVPEPGTLLSLGAGLALLAAGKFTRRAAKRA